MRLSISHYFNLQPVAKVIFGFIGSKRCKQQTSLVVDASHLLWTHSAGRHCSSCRSGTSSITLIIDRELFLGNGTSVAELNKSEICTRFICRSVFWKIIFAEKTKMSFLGRSSLVQKLKAAYI